MAISRRDCLPAQTFRSWSRIVIPDFEGFHLVTVDNFEASGAIIRHLGAQGFADCLVVGTSLEISNVRERWEGTQAAAGDMPVEFLGIGFDDPAPLALEARLRGPGRPSAVFCLDHGTTLAAYRLVREIGLGVSREIGFASFDEMEWMRLVEPPLTTVRQPVEDMAECAWAMLSRCIADDGPALRTRRLRCVVTIRESTSRHIPLQHRKDKETTIGG